MLHFSVPLAANIDATTQAERGYTNRDGKQGTMMPTVTGMAENG